MYDSLITLIQMLDKSEKSTCIKITPSYIIIDISARQKIFRYTQQGISRAIEELEPLL